MLHPAEHDSELFAWIEKEAMRQEAHLELIASENYVSPAVLAAQGSVLTNKYAEGYPGKRYYGGCAFVDGVESLAIERAKQLFDADYVNVQPHSGSQANAAVYQALLSPGDTILGLDLSQGGHLTHGSPVNFSGLHYNAVHYGLNSETGEIDYALAEALAKEHQPKLIIAGFSAYSGLWDWARFREIADAVGAYLLVDMAHVAGLIAAGLYPSPMPYADVVTTTTHKTLRGARGGMILSSKGDEDLYKRLNKAIFPGSQGGPLMHAIAGKAACFGEALKPDFKVYQQQVLDNAKAMVSVLKERGYPIVSDSTHNHLFIIDLRETEWTGKAAEARLEAAHMTCNKNTVPNDPRSPFVTSGLRMGTPALTTRGMKLKEAEIIAHCIADVLDAPEDDVAVLAEAQAKIAALTNAFPVYQ